MLFFPPPAKLYLPEAVLPEPARAPPKSPAAVLLTPHLTVELIPVPVIYKVLADVEPLPLPVLYFFHTADECVAPFTSSIVDAVQALIKFLPATVVLLIVVPKS